MRIKANSVGQKNQPRRVYPGECGEHIPLLVTFTYRSWQSTATVRVRLKIYGTRDCCFQSTSPQFPRPVGLSSFNGTPQFLCRSVCIRADLMRRAESAPTRGRFGGNSWRPGYWTDFLVQLWVNMQTWPTPTPGCPPGIRTYRYRKQECTLDPAPARQHHGQPTTRFLLRRRFPGRQLHRHQTTGRGNWLTPSLATQQDSLDGDPVC